MRKERIAENNTRAIFQQTKQINCEYIPKQSLNLFKQLLGISPSSAVLLSISLECFWILQYVSVVHIQCGACAWINVKPKSGQRAQPRLWQGSATKYW